MIFFLDVRSAVYLVDPKSKDRYYYDYKSIRESTPGRLVEPGDFTLSKEEKIYDLDFFKIPSKVEEFTLNLGRIKIDDKEIELPPVKYRKLTKYRYVPFIFGD